MSLHLSISVYVSLVSLLHFTAKATRSPGATSFQLQFQRGTRSTLVPAFTFRVLGEDPDGSILVHILILSLSNMPIREWGL